MADAGRKQLYPILGGMGLRWLPGAFRVTLRVFLSIYYIDPEPA